MPPEDDNRDVFYAYSTNKGLNFIVTTIFSKHVDKKHSLVNQGDRNCSAWNGNPRHTLILEDLTESKEKVRSEMFYNYVIDNNGDDDISKGIRRIDPALKFYSGIPLVININKGIKKGRVNGKLCRGIFIKLKKNKQLNWKN